VFVLLAVPLRLIVVVIHRRLRFGERPAHSLRVGVPMLPTTVFTLVLVDILRVEFQAPHYLLGALVIYAVINTLAPSLFLRTPPPEFQDELLLGDPTPPAPVPSPVRTVTPARPETSGSPDGGFSGPGPS
jgi:hypothetical protein